MQVGKCHVTIMKAHRLLLFLVYFLEGRQVSKIQIFIKFFVFDINNEPIVGYEFHYSTDEKGNHIATIEHRTTHRAFGSPQVNAKFGNIKELK